jgi:hypothetical protein
MTDEEAERAYFAQEWDHNKAYRYGWNSALAAVIGILQVPAKDREWDNNANRISAVYRQAVSSLKFPEPKS